MQTVMILNLVTVLLALFCLPISHGLPAKNSVDTSRDGETAANQLTERGIPGNVPNERGRRNVYGLLITQPVTHIYVMAHTYLNHTGAGSNSLHLFEIRVNNVAYTAVLEDMPGDQADPGKGDLWRLSMADFGITKWYPKRNTIQSFAIVKGGNDGWMIDSVITILKDESAVGHSDYEVATVDMEKHQWVDGDGSTAHFRFDLHKIY